MRQGSPEIHYWPPRSLPSGADAEAIEAELAQTRAWLHDRVLQLLEYVAAGGYADAPDLDELRRIVRIAADELRCFIDGEEPEHGPRDLGAALADAARDARVLAGGVRIRVVVGPARLALPGHVVDALAGAAREALVNAAKHARATRAVVRCTPEDGAVVVVVEDDGTGFDAATVQLRHGLRESIARRLNRIGAEALVESVPGAGTRVTLTFPLDGSPRTRVAA